MSEFLYHFICQSQNVIFRKQFKLSEPMSNKKWWLFCYTNYCHFIFGVFDWHYWAHNIVERACGGSRLLTLVPVSKNRKLQFVSLPYFKGILLMAEFSLFRGQLFLFLPLQISTMSVSALNTWVSGKK